MASINTCRCARPDPHVSQHSGAKSDSRRALEGRVGRRRRCAPEQQTAVPRRDACDPPRPPSGGTAPAAQDCTARHPSRLPQTAGSGRPAPLRLKGRRPMTLSHPRSTPVLRRHLYHAPARRAWRRCASARAHADHESEGAHAVATHSLLKRLHQRGRRGGCGHARDPAHVYRPLTARLQPQGGGARRSLRRPPPLHPKFARELSQFVVGKKIDGHCTRHRSIQHGEQQW